MPPKQKPPTQEQAITIIAGALAIGASAQATATSLSASLGVPAPSLLALLILSESRPIQHFGVPTLPSATASA